MRASWSSLPSTLPFMERFESARPGKGLFTAVIDGRTNEEPAREHPPATLDAPLSARLCGITGWKALFPLKPTLHPRLPVLLAASDSSSLTSSSTRPVPCGSWRERGLAAKESLRRPTRSPGEESSSEKRLLRREEPVSPLELQRASRRERAAEKYAMWGRHRFSRVRAGRVMARLVNQSVAEG
mmetsp:Transcript_15648/g.43898  ORF Transcript_15648/g.43898 Transcript_15648/m.43898 type:complete len:184 (+) Transcript_15648:182-733(+)